MALAILQMLLCFPSVLMDFGKMCVKRGESGFEKRSFQPIEEELEAFEPGGFALPLPFILVFCLHVVSVCQSHCAFSSTGSPLRGPCHYQYGPTRQDRQPVMGFFY